MSELVRPGGELAAFFYLDDNERGPPFGTSREELHRLLDQAFSLREDEPIPPRDSLAVFAGKEICSFFGSGGYDGARMLIGSVTVYLLLTVAIGLWAAQRVHNSKDYVVAGRSLPLYMSAATVFATWFGAERCSRCRRPSRGTAWAASSPTPSALRSACSSWRCSSPVRSTAWTFSPSATSTTSATTRRSR